MNVSTIGFTKKSAERFFELLSQAGTKRLIDVRLNNVSQLAGFTKRDDLRFFLREVGGIDYVHAPNLAPTQELLRSYRTKDISWDEYRTDFLDLMAARSIENEIELSVLEDACLLCSEAEPHHCQRRLMTEYRLGVFVRDIRRAPLKKSRARLLAANIVAEAGNGFLEPIYSQYRLICLNTYI